jgi:hypothetical protein
MLKEIKKKLKEAKTRLMKWIVIKAAGDIKVAINCDLLDYNREKNFMKGEYISYSNKFYPIERLIVEEMYTGSPNKKVTRNGNTFVLNII